MANLPPVGVQAVVEGIGTYLSDMGRVNQAMDNAGTAAERAAKRTGVFSDGLKKFGAAVAALGLTGLFGKAISEAGDFDKSLRNIQATALLSNKEIALIGNNLLDMSKKGAYGANTIAEAMYDVVGGVQDASKWNAILKASLDTAEAGQADLRATTAGLIYVMNAYGYTAKDATKVSDVLTRTVGVGVGTMDQFVAAISPIAITAKTLEVDFKDLGAMMAYLTTKGTTTGESATELQGIMQAILKPTTAMKDGIKALGFESGSAMLKQLGFIGTLNALKKVSGGSTDALAKMFGRVEGLKGVLALTNGDFGQFNQNFDKGLKGATANAKAVQEQAGAFDRFNASMEALMITVGEKLLPTLYKLADWLRGMINGMGDAAPTILLIAGALGVVALVAGPVGAVLAAILSPLGLLIGAAVALYAAYNSNFLGIRDLVQSALGTITAFIQTTVLPALNTFVQWFTKTALPTVVSYVQNTVLPGIKKFFDWLAGVWNDTVAPQLNKLYNWFTKEALPAVINFVKTTVIPGIQALIDKAVEIWTVVEPYLQKLYNWFITDAMPAISEAAASFQKNIIQPLVDILAGLWKTVQPALESLWSWFTKDGIPGIATIAKDLWENILKPLVKLLETIWEIVRPGLEAVAKFFNEQGPKIGNAIGDFITKRLNELITTLRSVIDWLGEAIRKITEFLNLNNQTSSLGATKFNEPFTLGAGSFRTQAGGGPFGAGDMSWVGEQGPELVAWGRSGFVIPSGISRALAAVGRAMASPAPMASGSSYANNTYNNQQTSGDIVFNGVEGTDDTIRRMAVLRAIGKVR